MKRILDPAFRYRPSFATDVRETFAKARREQEQKLAQEAASVATIAATHASGAATTSTAIARGGASSAAS